MIDLMFRKLHLLAMINETKKIGLLSSISQLLIYYTLSVRGTP